MLHSKEITDNPPDFNEQVDILLVIYTLQSLSFNIFYYHTFYYHTFVEDNYIFCRKP